ncbi:MAG TPA: serine protease, partial [Phototrophicaceae bacterium]|nr:serine protease [Phototrophicaceae bacterium]
MSQYSFGQSLVPPFDFDRVRRATVFIMQTELVAGKPVITCVSSGTLVSRDGLILTNAHSTVQSTDCPGDQLIIALSVRPGEPPVGTYQADVIDANVGLDIALLRVTREYDGRVINPTDLALPFVELDNSDEVQLDDTLWVVGYPGIGDDPVAEARVTVPGFTSEPGGGEKSWFKITVDPESTLGSITGIMSGGGAYNRVGKLVGIPTTAPITRVAAVSECRLVQDTNSDGLVNQNDNCIPLGGTINVLRPSNFAALLLRSASLGLKVSKLSEVPTTRQIIDTPRVTRMFFASSVSNNTPASVISNLPTGSTSLYLFFDYENMTPETVYEMLVTIRGIPAPAFSLSPVRWSGGERGLWYIGTS